MSMIQLSMMPNKAVTQPSKRKLILLTLLLIIVAVPCGAVTIKRALPSVFGEQVTGIIVSESSQVASGAVYKSGDYTNYNVQVNQNGATKTYQLRLLNQGNLNVGDQTTIKVYNNTVAPTGFDWLIVFGGVLTLTLLILTAALIRKYLTTYKS